MVGPRRGTGKMQEGGASNHRGSRPQEEVGVQPGRKPPFWGSLCERPASLTRRGWHGAGRVRFPTPRPTRERQVSPGTSGGRTGRERILPDAAAAARGPGDGSFLDPSPTIAASHVTLGKPGDLAEPQFPAPMGFVGGSNEITFVKCLLEIAGA